MRPWTSVALLAVVLIKWISGIQGRQYLDSRHDYCVQPENFKICDILRVPPGPPQKRFLRFGRSLAGDSFLRFGRQFYRIGRDGDDKEKRFLRFGRSDGDFNELLRDAILREELGEPNQRKKRSTDSVEKVDEAPANKDIEKRDAEVNEKEKRFMRFGRSGENEKRFMRFGKSVDAEKRFMRFGKSGNEEKRFMRFGRGDAEAEKRFMRFGKSTDDKRFMRFGRAGQDEKRFMRFGRAGDGLDEDVVIDEESELSPEKRFMRFGRDGEEEKRFMRFGKSGNEDKRFMRFGKRFMRFGRDGEDEKRFMRFGKRFMRFGKRDSEASSDDTAQAEES